MKTFRKIGLALATLLVVVSTTWAEPPCPDPPLLNQGPDAPSCAPEHQLDPCRCSQDFTWDAVEMDDPFWYEVVRRSQATAASPWTPWVMVGVTNINRWWVVWDAGDSSRSQDDGLQRAGQVKPGWIYEYGVRVCHQVGDTWEIECGAISNIVAYRGVQYERSTNVGD